MQQLLYWRIRISVRYTGPHLSTVLRVLAFTDRQSFPAYDRRISELMWLINNNASCNNRVLGLFLGPSAGLYGIVKRSALTVRGQAHCSAFERTTHRGSIVLFYPVGGSMANAALPMQCPSDTLL